jgi:IS1 family transposase
VVAVVIGKRTQKRADLLLDRVLQATDEHVPFFTSDQLQEYRRALLHAYGMWHQPQRQGNRGRYPKPLLMAPPGLLYAQVVKMRAHGRVVEVNSKVVFGDPKTIAEKLTSLPTSAIINTSFVERHNLTQHQSSRRLTRRTNGFSKDLSWFERQLWLSLAYYHLALPHRRLRQPDGRVLV